MSHIGNVYIADTDNQRIRKVTVSTDIISTIAGSGTSGSYSGDNGIAISAGLSYPYSVTIDSSGTVYIALLSFYYVLLTCSINAGNLYVGDNGNNRIRKVTVAATYTPRYTLHI